MKNLIKAIVLIFIIIVLPMSADVMSKIITMDMIIKCVYLTSGLAGIYFYKECR